MMLSINEQEEIVKRIRRDTGYSVMEIIKALRCCNWEADMAIALLRKNGGYAYDKTLPK